MASVPTDASSATSDYEREAELAHAKSASGMDFDSIDFTEDLDEVLDLSLDVELWRISKEPPFIRARDKLVFVLGVIDVVLLAFFLHGHPSFFPYFYTVKYPILIFFRFYMYQRNSWAWFLLDFCYYCNLLLLAQLWIWPNEPRLFIVVFCAVNGPLAWAVILFRNSLVFHSIDKMTSAYIHISPLLMVYIGRWRLSPQTDFSLTPCRDADCSTTWLYTLALPVAFFAAHQVLYFLLVHVACKRVIDNNPNALTVYRYLVKGNRKGLIFKVSSVCGGAMRKVMFSVWYTLFAAVTILPTVLFYRYEWLNFLWICFIGLVCVWNGANFYIEVFARKYEGNADRKASIVNKA